MGNAQHTAQHQEAAFKDHLLSLAWNLIQERGYQALTLNRLSKTANLKETEIHHLWPNRNQLGLAAYLAYGRNKLTLKQPNAGNLQRDLLQLFNDLRSDLNKLGSPKLHGLLSDALWDVPLTHVLSVATGHDIEGILRALLKRADHRHEIQLKQLSPYAQTLPLTIFTSEVIDGHQFSKDDINEIVTQLLIPAFTASKVKWI